MRQDWSFFSGWEHSTGNKWGPLEFRGLRKKWKYAVQGELKCLLPSGDGTRLMAVSGKEWGFMLDLDGREIWKISLMPTYVPHASISPPPNMILAEWFYPETLFVQMAGVPRVLINPDSGEIIRQTFYIKDTDGADDYDPNMSFATSTMLSEAQWLTVCNPNAIAQIQRSGYLANPAPLLLAPCLGWGGAYSKNGELKPPLRSNYDGPNKLALEVIISDGAQQVFLCLQRDSGRHLRLVRDGDFAGASIIQSGTDAWRQQWWLECRRMSDLENVVWQTGRCCWLHWFVGTGRTVWYTEKTEIQGKGTDWLVGLELETGKEFHRKAEPCRYFGMICGPLLITANARTITAWEPVV